MKSLSHQQRLTLQNIVYYALLMASFVLLAWLSVHFNIQFDLSANNRNSLNEASVAVLRKVPGSVNVTAFINDNRTARKAINKLISRYQRHKADLRLTFIDPDSNPKQVRELGISSGGELLIEYQGRTERLQQLNEQTFTNALHRLSRDGESWLLFLTGHNERDPYSQANHGFSEFTRWLGEKGIKTQTHNLLNTPVIPDNTQVLVIAAPTTDYASSEIKIVSEYISRGGNLLWFIEPEDSIHLQDLARQLGVNVLPGVIVDPNARMLGVEQQDFAIINSYPYTSITPNFAQITLFPQAAGLEVLAQNKFGLIPVVFLNAPDQSWLETENEQQSPSPNTQLAIGISWERHIEDVQQRLVVLGDSDFLSNTYLGNGGNLELGLNIVNWLSNDEDMLEIRPVVAPDIQLQLSENQLIAIAGTFFLLLPAAFVVTGILIWLKRRNS